MTKLPWTLACSACAHTADAAGLHGVCPKCGAPYLVRYAGSPAPGVRDEGRERPGNMWRFREWLPLADGEEPVTLGEGATPLLPVPRIAAKYGFDDLRVKDESVNPTGSFKARGLAAAVTRGVLAGARAFVVPTAGNAGVALSAYAARAGAAARVYAPTWTPRPILEQIAAYGAELELVEGHIGECGKRSREYAAKSGAVDVSTLREPYRIEGKKTLGLELAEQYGWTLPQAIVYPTGGGTGLIGMWKAFAELQAAGWVPREARLPRLFSVQSAGCAPVVRAWEAGAEQCDAWDDPVTVAAGLRVPNPLGGRLMLRALRESDGGAVAVSDAALTEKAEELARLEGLDASPEGGAALAAAILLRERGRIRPEGQVVVFNTGAGWLYRDGRA